MSFNLDHTIYENKQIQANKMKLIKFTKDIERKRQT